MTTARVPMPRKLPAWLAYSFLTVVLWGAWGVQSKMVVDRISPWMNQVLFSLGLIPPVLWLCFSPNLNHRVPGKKAGVAYAFLTGILGGTGNIAFYLSLHWGGKASTVVPLTCLFPVVAVMLAMLVLRETMSRTQASGLVVALVSIYLLST